MCNLMHKVSQLKQKDAKPMEALITFLVVMLLHSGEQGCTRVDAWGCRPRWLPADAF